MRVPRAQLAYVVICAMLFSAVAGAVTKVHVIAFGKWTSARWFPTGTEEERLILKIRPLLVDGRV
jgi:hypothetical protein